MTVAIPRENEPTGARPSGLRRTFDSLASRNYRLFFVSGLVSETGSWMQTMAEAWLVLTLTHSGADVGLTFAFRFAPVFFFGLWGGAIADRFDRRRLLIVTQTLSALLGVVLWLVVLSGVVHAWMVFALAFALGLVTVADQPAHHAFVQEMVGADRVSNAVALNNAVINSARITGPALAGLVIATTGVAWVFLVDALSFVVVIGALLAMQRDDLSLPEDREHRPRVRDGLAHAWSVSEIRTTIVLVGVVGTLVFNFPTFMTLLAKQTFHGGAGLAGLLMAILGAGTVIGALVAAHRARQGPGTVRLAAGGLGTALLVAAAAPGKVPTMILLVPVGALAVFFGSVANAHMQLSSSPSYRGRMMAIYSMLTLGMTVVGGPLMGWVCQRWSPRVGLAVAGGATLLVALTLSAAIRPRALALAAPSA